MAYKVTVSSKLQSGFPMVMTVATSYQYVEDAIERAHVLVETMRDAKREHVHALVTEASAIVMVIE